MKSSLGGMTWMGLLNLFLVIGVVMAGPSDSHFDEEETFVRIVVKEMIKEFINDSLTALNRTMQIVETRIKELGNNSCVNEEVVSKDEKKNLVDIVELHRYWNPSIGDHFYTTAWTELGGGKDGWSYEGVQGLVFQSPQDGTVPLFWYWNSALGDHHYTTDWNELKGGTDYILESIACYIYYPIPKGGTTPLYRYFNGGIRDHFYTTNWTELGGGTSGWHFEGIAGYIYPK